MTTHTLTSPQFKGEIVFVFNAAMKLIYFDIRAMLDDEQHEYITRNTPTTIADLKKFRSATTTITVTPTDLGFETFWDMYAFKEGTKKRAASTWSRMSKENRIKALEYIRIYEGTRPKWQNKQLPETYLSSERWNNG
jgi:hypothetical protein